MIKIISVLKTGGEFTTFHVEKLYDMCQKHITVPYIFYCLSDDPSIFDNKKLTQNTKIIPLKYNLHGWWSKLEIYSLEGPCLYFDLDSIIVSNIDDIINTILPYSFIGLRDVFHKNNLQLSIIYWNDNKKFILEDFLNNIEKYTNQSKFIEEHTMPPNRALSDQDSIPIILHKNNIEPIFFQDIITDIVSYKVDLNYGSTFDPNMHKIIFFHGQPRPWHQDNIPY